MPERISIADLVGPWTESDFDSSLITRCRSAWHKPLHNLTNRELSALLVQRIAVEHLLPIAEQRVADGIEDGTEIDDDDLQYAIAHATHS